MDRIDFEIIEHLQNNARLSNKELASLIGLAPSSCLQRVKNLEKNQVLKGYHAKVSEESMGIGIKALISISLVMHRKDIFEAFYQKVLKLKEVIHAYHLTGSKDVMVFVALKDINHLRTFVLESIATNEEVSRYETSIVYDFRNSYKLPCFKESD